MTTTAFRQDWHKTDEQGRLRPGVRGGRVKPIAEHSRLYVPAGWPEQVSPPESKGWERTAENFLLDCCPPDYRGYALLRRQPIVLARMAAQHVESQIRATREGLVQARDGLSDYVDAPVLDDTVEVLQTEEARLVRLRRAVLLVEESLRGKVFVARL